MSCRVGLATPSISARLVRHRRTGTATTAKAFTLLEVAASLIILALITSSALVVINRCMKATIDETVKVQAFEIAREKMEKLLAANAVEETLEQGTSEENPDIQWQTVVEPFYEPITSKMWIRAVCSATYTDTHNELQTIEFAHWITDLTKKQIIDILKQKQLQKQEQFAEIQEFLWDYIDTVPEDLLLELYNQMTGEENELEDIDDFEEIIKYILDNLDALDSADENILIDLYNQATEIDITEADATEKQDPQETKVPDDQKQDEPKKPKKPPKKPKDNLFFGYTEQELNNMSFEELWMLIMQYDKYQQ